MSDQYNNDSGGNENVASTPPFAFCQNCGRPLDKDGARVVGSAVYCEPCLAVRLGGAPTNSAGVPPGAAPGAGSSNAWSSGIWPPSGIGPSTPNPGLATLLGFIPGVGAMYNEQYAKGIVHLIVFAVLVTLVNANGIFLLFVFGWVFYMAFEAHHTAKARRDGTPLPNPFGLNDIGERFGFGKAWPPAPRTTPPNPSAPPPSASYGAGGSTYPNWNAGPAASVPPAQEVPGWGAPVDEYATASHPGDQTAYGQAPPAPGYGPFSGTVPPYGAPIPPFGSGPYNAPPYNATYVPPVPGDSAYVTPLSRFPGGAVWLIALGTLFLLTTTGIFHGFAGGILVGFLLIGLGVWVFVRRMFETGSGFTGSGTPEYPLRVFRAARGAVWLVLVGLLLLLNDAHILRWHNSWPLFIIVAGVMALLERAAWTNASSTYTPVPHDPPVHPAATTSLSVVPTHDESDSSESNDLKGGR